jgi:hypothetical protein
VSSPAGLPSLSSAPKSHNGTLWCVTSASLCHQLGLPMARQALWPLVRFVVPLLPSLFLLWNGAVGVTIEISHMSALWPSRGSPSGSQAPNRRISRHPKAVCRGLTGTLSMVWKTLRDGGGYRKHQVRVRQSWERALAPGKFLRAFHGKLQSQPNTVLCGRKCQV